MTFLLRLLDFVQSALNAAASRFFTFFFTTPIFSLIGKPSYRDIQQM